MNLLRLSSLLMLSIAAFARSVPSLHSSRIYGLGSYEDVDTTEYPFMRPYPGFQISDGFGGSADEEAAEIFIRPFENVDLASVPFEVYDKLKLAKEAVEDAEIELFKPAISQAGSETDDGRALKVGLMKNRVLFATAGLQVAKIEAAHNKVLHLENPNEESVLTFSEAYLAWTIEADSGNDGQPSLGAT